MLSNLLIVAEQVEILFVLIGVGCVCRKLKLIDEFSVRGMIHLLVLIVTPALVIDCFQRPFDPSMLRQLGLAFLIATLAHAVAIALAYLTARGDGRTRPVLRLATVFSNAGFMGIPLEYAILGPKGVFFGITYVAMFNVFMWSWGLREMKSGDGRAKEGTRRRDLKMFVNPGTVGIALGLPLFLLSVTLPAIVARPIHMLAELNTPLAMVVIGYYLAGADLKAIVRVPAFHLTAFLRLVAVPLAVLGGLCLARGFLDRTMALAMVTAAGAPVAAMVTIFSANYGRDIDLSVGLVSGTTLLGILTMPAVISLAMVVF